MQPREITVDELAPLLEAGAHLIDVRDVDEFEQARIPGSILIPLYEVSERIDDIPVGGTVYVLCRSGGRSRMAGEYLSSRGIDAVNVTGGILAWIESGRSVISGPA